MLRNIVLLLNLFILLIYQALVSNTVTINQKSPDTVKAGDEFTVEITISKGTISGFAKLQQDLPAGFTASSGDAKGGSFTFSDQKVKFIWMSLPADAEFKVSYKVKVADNISGDFSFNGIFSYLENNDKKNAEMPIKNIKVTPSSSAPLANNTTQTNNNNSDDEEDEDDDDSGSSSSNSISTSNNNLNTNTNSTPIAQNNNSASNDEEEEDEEDDNPVNQTLTNNTQNVNLASGSVQCIRTINTANLASNREIIVNITVNKGAIAGFAKLQETLPVGFTATNIEASQGVFSFVDQKAKFLWMSLPAEPTIKVSYKITVAPGITGVYYLNGEFSYVENDETKKSIIERQEINLDATPAIAQNNNNQADLNSSNNIQAAINKQNTGSGQQQASTTTSTNAGRQAATKVNNGGGNNITNIPAPQTGINFRVQIAAGHTPVSASYFKTTKGIEDYVNVEDHEGWKKYTIGGYTQYKEARDKREYVKTTNGVNGPFVTAYNNGVRITVQEALMISNQRWVQ
ncbi:MAG: hypothetical protein ACK4IK_11885 [Bacteroidia bacterium]